MTAIDYANVPEWMRGITLRWTAENAERGRRDVMVVRRLPCGMFQVMDMATGFTMYASQSELSLS